MDRQEEELIQHADAHLLSPIALHTESNMVAEPVIGSAAMEEDVLARVSAIEEKLKSMAKMLNTVDQQATEAVGRSVLTNVRVNHVIARLDTLSTASTQVKTTRVENVTGSEQKSDNNIPVNPTGVSDEFVTIAEGCVKAIIGPKGDRVSKIRELTGVTRIDLGFDQKFLVRGTDEQRTEAKKLMKEVAEGRLDSIGEKKAVIQFESSKARDVIGPRGQTVKRIQGVTGAYIEVKDTLLKGRASASITGSETKVNEAILAIQQVIATGEFKKGSGKGKGQAVKSLLPSSPFTQAPEKVPTVNIVQCECDGIRMLLTNTCGSCGGIKLSQQGKVNIAHSVPAQSQGIAKTIKQELVNMTSEMRQQAIRLACSTQSQDIADFMTCSVTQSQEIVRVVRRELNDIYWKHELNRMTSGFDLAKHISENAGREIVLYGEACKRHGITPEPLVEEANAVIEEAVKWRSSVKHRAVANSVREKLIGIYMKYTFT